MANPFKEAEKKNKKAPGSKQEPAGEKNEVVEVTTPVEPEKPAEAPVEPVMAKEESKPVEVVAEQEVVEEAPKTAEKTKKAGTKPAQPVKEKSFKDMFADLDTEKPAGKTYAFYLSDENVKKLKALATKKGTSASKLLDHILSEVL